METKKIYNGPYSKVNGLFGGVDDLGRKLSSDTNVPEIRKDRKVGIFYFLWIGEHGTSGPYDISAIAKAHPEAVTSEDAWYKAGGGPQQAHHFWGKPLFGYYRTGDDWVMRKHLQMLTDAGIDFIVFDATNFNFYEERVKQLIAVWYEYMEKGVDVPKIAFYTNTGSGKAMDNIFNAIYKSEELNARYPKLNDLWFKWDGKPMIVGLEAEASEEVKSYFTLKESTWPNAGRTDNGFPWMEFGRLLTEESVYGRNGRKEVMNVSVAQHSDTVRFSAAAWYGGNDRTRSWHDGANDTSEGAVKWGYNFAEQWEYALKQDPEMIFITGWNEWVAQRQRADLPGEPIWFVDCATYNCSRDVEPAAEEFGDNYYMQLCEYIRKYKGASRRVYIGDDYKIDINGDFSQWDSEAVTARYTDYSDDTADRSGYFYEDGIKQPNGFGGMKYVNNTGRNDFVSLKVAHDYDNIYFYAETADNITAQTDENWMTLFIKSGTESGADWYGYDFAVNVEKPEIEGAVLSQCKGGWNWDRKAIIPMKVEGNKMMLSISKKDIGICGDSVIDLQFKWADNYQKNEKGSYDINTFYCDGDAAPYGRLNYIYSEKA